MITDAIAHTIETWLKTNNFPKDTLFSCALTETDNDMFSVYVAEEGNPDQVGAMITFKGDLPREWLNRATLTREDLLLVGNVRDKNTKRAFIDYLTEHREQRFYQAVVNFTKEKTKLDCWSMRIAKSPEEPIGLDIFNIEADNYINEN